MITIETEYPLYTHCRSVKINICYKLFCQGVKMISQKSIMALNYVYQTGILLNAKMMVFECCNILRTMHGMDFFFAFLFFFSDIQSCINSGFIYLRTSILCLSVCLHPMND